MHLSAVPSKHCEQTGVVLCSQILQDASMEDAKLRYHELMIALALSDELELTTLRSPCYLDACRHYRALFDTPAVQQDAARRSQVSLRSRFSSLSLRWSHLLSS